MELELTESYKKILMGFLLIILPWIVILIGIITNVVDAIGSWASWYYILAITWFGAGIVFFNALD